jgi:hypothetical protein
LNFYLAFYKPSKEPEYHYTKETINVGWWHNGVNDA